MHRISCPGFILVVLALLAPWSAGCSDADSSGDSSGLPLLSVSRETHEEYRTERTLQNTLGMEFIRVPAGEFRMGSGDARFLGERAFSEQPIHLVRIHRDFAMGRFEVTVGQFRQFATATGFRTEAERDGMGCNELEIATGHVRRNPERNWRNPGFEQNDRHPVVCISAEDAMAFCDWLGKQDEHTYRLPTEAEWEYCCRAGTQTRYYTGDLPESLEGTANIADQSLQGHVPLVASWAVTWSDQFAFTAPVGSLTPNPWGLHDMLGNVGEWCSDWYAAGYYQLAPADYPTGPVEPTDYRIVRGSSWYNAAESARSANRHDGVPTHRSTTNGFRVVLELPLEQTP